ncbi:uncharacterized protein LOC107643561 isoform X1 [Arachis ipaensis]|uniref:uncharacterized protein n=1 Tax=Arachis hypogaea TaxID=3818 RepID=UPI0007AF61E7|nr:uncharacterized protein LOC107643561 isoform X1 [Arachis ipaensis]XP_025630920.1 uncharacterized protein LOC112723688 [Arachis hypogaea]QHO22069.1 DNA-directed RNA polymerase III subunit [Arachis hypogaea]
MDSNRSNNAPGRKVKFAPKAPPRRAPKKEVKAELAEDHDAEQAKDLLRRFNESAMNGRHKVEKKVSASQIAFGYGGEATSFKPYRNPSSGSDNSAFSGVREKEYKEPWDYYSNYPVTLPLRRPYSGNPELLDEEEFGEAAESRTFDENSTNPAKELGLLEENPETSVFLIQLPAALPAIKGSASSGGQDGSESSCKPQGSMKKVKPCKLNELPPGLMGKMLVYKSGAIKLKLGDTLYDVSPGSNCTFAQDVAVMNTAEKHCCAIGEISKRVTVTPDIDDMISVTRWVKPPIGKVKLNCNTSLSLAMVESKETGKLEARNTAGFGAVLRDDKGAWFKGCAGNLPPEWSVCHREIFAMWTGLRLAWDCGVRDVVCETDSREAFMAVQQHPETVQRDYDDLLMNIQEMQSRSWKVEFNLVLREANNVAHLLAEKGAEGSEDSVKYVEWLRPLNFVLDAVRRDSQAS